MKSSLLSDSAMHQAVRYNQSIGQGKAFWRRVQSVVGATVDGMPGRDTANRVANWQAAEGLGIDGKVGPATQRAMQVHERVQVLKPGSEPFFFVAPRVAVNCDGCPRAYKEGDPPDAIDYLANAGWPNRGGWGLALDQNGAPFVQHDGDPAPGFYVSVTSLFERSYPEWDPRRYVDAAKVPYLVLPRNVAELGSAGLVRRGDVGLVMRANGRMQFGMWADTSGDGKLGEASVAMLQELGHDPFHNGKATQSLEEPTLFVIFPRTGEGEPLAHEEVVTRGQSALRAWGDNALARAWDIGGRAILK